VNSKRPVTIGVAGGTGSGKTTVATQILERVGSHHIAYLPHDAYYKDLKDMPLDERGRANWDHPDALDTHLMIENIKQLQQNRAAYMPVYDFTRDARAEETVTVTAQPIILVEGILIFVEPELRELMDIKIFVDTDADIRFIRRLKRDISDRGRTAESVIEQYLSTVRPMHLKFVEPTKRYADVIVPEGGFNFVAIDMIADRIRSMLAQN
jgi:uridine kinase